MCVCESVGFFFVYIDGCVDNNLGFVICMVGWFSPVVVGRSRGGKLRFVVVIVVVLVVVELIWFGSVKITHKNKK